MKKEYILQVNYQLLYDNGFHGNCSHFMVIDTHRQTQIFFSNDKSDQSYR